jgi:N-acetylmuramoyl-L-alanine amidase
MNSIITALLLSLASAPAGLRAQPGQPWTIESGPRSSRVVESTARGYAALPASVLVSVGAEVSYERNGLVVQVGAHQVAVASGAAQVTVDGTARPLAHAVYAEGGVVFLPVDFFRELLPGLTGGRVRVDVAGRTIRGSAARPAGTVAEAEEVVAAEPTPRPDPARPPQRKLVVVDAGHGGRDPGASGPGGTREKDVTLAVARRLAAILREDPSLEVRMTRDRDTLIALHDRARLANRWRDEGQPALFISVHCNANPSRSEKGYETYFLAEARTADAQRVEAFENASVKYEEAPAGGPMAFILTDLRRNQHLRESSDWAQLIQNRLREIHPGPNRGVKQAGFAVLRGAFMPAVLVEIGFVSNPAEERLLNAGEMQRDIAEQLARSVHDFFARSQQGSASR